MYFSDTLTIKPKSTPKSNLLPQLCYFQSNPTLVTTHHQPKPPLKYNPPVNLSPDLA